jgi:hypothetical protein
MEASPTLAAIALDRETGASPLRSCTGRWGKHVPDVPSMWAQECNLAYSN